MSTNYPSLFDGQPLRSTTVVTTRILTNVVRFMDMSEQRYVMNTPTTSIKGTYNTLALTEVTGLGPTHSLQDFQDAVQGRFGEFTLNFNGNVYSNCYLDQTDTMTFQENSVNLYSGQVIIKQFASGGFPSITVSDPSLPTLGNGTSGPQNQYPNPVSHAQSNVIVDVGDNIARYTWHRINSPIPAGALVLKAITIAEMTVFENFFIQMGGRYGLFSLTYNGVSHTGNCRFDTDEFTVDYTNFPAVTVTLPWTTVPV